MKDYTIKIRVTGYYTVTVPAYSEDDAIDAALLRFEEASNDDITDVCGDAYSVTDPQGKTNYIM